MCRTISAAGGALAVADGDGVVPVINSLAKRFGHVVLTQDWHPPGHSSFASSHRVFRFGIPPVATMSALNCSTVVRCTHRRLPDRRKRIRLGETVAAHDLQDGGEDNAPGTYTVFESFDMGARELDSPMAILFSLPTDPRGAVAKTKEKNWESNENCRRRMRRRIAACACSISARVSLRHIAPCCSASTAPRSSRSNRRKATGRATWERPMETTPRYLPSIIAASAACVSI
jgi:hypothetical protein